MIKFPKNDIKIIERKFKIFIFFNFNKPSDKLILRTIKSKFSQLL